MTEIEDWVAVVTAPQRDGKVSHYILARGTKEACEAARSHHGELKAGGVVLATQNMGRVDVMPFATWQERKAEGVL